MNEEQLKNKNENSSNQAELVDNVNTDYTEQKSTEIKQDNEKVMSVKDWIITLLIYAIPIINLIMLFVWAFSEGENKNKTNWAKATLVWIAITVGLAILTFVMLLALGASLSGIH